MIEKIAIALFACASICFEATAQFNFKVLPATGINTPNDDIACGLYENKLLIATNGKQDLVNDYKWNKRNIFHLELATRGNSFAEWKGSENLFDYSAPSDEGPATYSKKDSVLYFSSANNYGKSRSYNLRIFSVKKTEEGWSDPQLLPFCDGNSDYAHPWFDDEQNLLVFSSNRPGGEGQMDIWFCYKIDGGWSDPINCGMMVNGPGNELFPSVYNGDIYYSSDSGDGLCGFDLKKALRSQQWKSSVLLSEPINSSFDDIAIFFLDQDKGLLTSNRGGGSTGDDIYVVERTPSENEKHSFTAQLICDGQPRSDAKVTVTNTLNEIVIDANTDTNGNIPIELLRLNRKYKLQLSNIDPSLFKKCVLLIKDERGVVIKELRFDAYGVCELELLNLNYAGLNLMKLEDESILTIDISGQLYQQQPGDLKQSEPIMILDDKGDVVAVAYTNETGKFKFNDVKPAMDYTFKLAEESKAQNVLITDKGEKIVLPVLKAEIHFQRLQPDEAIALINEYSEMIYVSPKDIFVINRIYYEYNSAKLTAEAKTQLNKLVLIMKNNPSIQLELRSHTDSRGNDQYNQKLSERRAHSAVQYMASEQINLSQMMPVGMGETQLLNECDDGVECSEPEHALNRRTEIKLSKVGKAGS